MGIKRIILDESHLVTGLFDKYRVFYKEPSDIALAEAFIRDRLEKNESVIFVAFETENGQAVPVGFTQLYPQYSSVSATKNWILNDLYVDGSHRKQGIGEALIKTAMNFAKTEGATFLQLETAVDNYTAQSVYQAIGFKKQEPESGYLVYRVWV
jgi:ribosomal protein S18 acetylase RimI-like enzyme